MQRSFNVSLSSLIFFTAAISWDVSSFCFNSAKAFTNLSLNTGANSFSSSVCNTFSRSSSTIGRISSASFSSKVPYCCTNFIDISGSFWICPNGFFAVTIASIWATLSIISCSRTYVLLFSNIWICSNAFSKIFFWPPLKKSNTGAVSSASSNRSSRFLSTVLKNSTGSLIARSSSKFFFACSIKDLHGNFGFTRYSIMISANVSSLSCALFLKFLIIVSSSSLDTEKPK